MNHKLQCTTLELRWGADGDLSLARPALRTNVTSANSPPRSEQCPFTTGKQTRKGKTVSKTLQRPGKMCDEEGSAFLKGNTDLRKFLKLERFFHERNGTP